MSISVISLFCGPGGFDRGFEEAGIEIELALDIDPVAVQTYNHNRNHEVAVVADLSVTTGKEIAALIRERGLRVPRGVVGGSPCQTFSSSNVHADATDARHTLPKKFAEIIKDLNDEFSLDFFVFENVHGITYKKHNKTFKEFKRLFRQAGFRLFEGLMNALDHGVAQDRPRVFVIGINKRKYPKAKFAFPKPSGTRKLHVRDKIAGLERPVFYKRSLTREDVTNAAGHPNHWTMQPKSPKFKNGYLKQGDDKGRSFRVLSWDKPSWTVAYGNREIHVHPEGTRRLSLLEAMLLQGFEQTYELMGNLSDQVRQVSDAIPPQMGKAIGKAIQEFLTGARCEPSLKDGAPDRSRQVRLPEVPTRLVRRTRAPVPLAHDN